MLVSLVWVVVVVVGIGNKLGVLNLVMKCR